MSDTVDVTDRDREMAAKAIGEVDYAHPGIITAWVASGEDMPHDDSDGGSTIAEDDAELWYFVAAAIAQARAEGVASERARWLAEVDRAASWFAEQSALNFKCAKDNESPWRENARGYAFKCSAKRMHKMKSKMAKD